MRVTSGELLLVERVVLAGHSTRELHSEFFRCRAVHVWRVVASCPCRPTFGAAVVWIGRGTDGVAAWADACAIRRSYVQNGGAHGGARMMPSAAPAVHLRSMSDLLCERVCDESLP